MGDIIPSAKLLQSIFQEAVQMNSFEHGNVMRIIGVSLEPRKDRKIIPELILPYMDKGDLLSHLKKTENQVTYNEVGTSPVYCL